MRNIERYKHSSSSGVNDSAVCSSCGGFKVQPESIWFDEQGLGYSTRLTKCPYCGKIIILGYIEDYGLDVNSDSRVYEYR